MSVEPDLEEFGRPKSSWLVISAAVVVAVVLVGLIVWSSDPGEDDLAAVGSTTTVAVVPPSISSSSTSTTLSATTSTPATTTTSNVVVSERAGVGDLVLGWSGTLYAVVGDSQDTFVRLESEREQGVPVRNMVNLPPGSIYYDLDASGRLFAFAVADDNEVETLHVTSADADIVDFELSVTSLVWHASEPGQLGVISERPDGTAHLVTLDFEGLQANRAGAQSIVDIDPSAELVAWSEHGFVIWSHDEALEQDMISLIGQSGEPLWEQAEDHLAAAISPSGEVLVNRFLPEGFEFAVVPALQPEAAQTVELPVQDVTGAAWAPDGQQLAIHFYEGTGKAWTLHIYDRQGNLIDSSSFDFRVWDIAWSPDQRFILMPGSDDRGTHAVLIYDTQASLLTPVEFTTWIHWVAVR